MRVCKSDKTTNAINFQLLFSRIKINTCSLPITLNHVSYLFGCYVTLKVTCYPLNQELRIFRHVSVSSADLDKASISGVDKFFPNRKADPENCKLDKIPAVLIRPDLPEVPKRILVIRTGPGSIDYRNFIRRTWKQQVTEKNKKNLESIFFRLKS